MHDRANNAGRRRPLIAILDDDTGFRRIMADALEACGFAVAPVANASELFVLLETHRPDLVLLDLGLGDEEGEDVARRLRAVSSVPVVVLTARTGKAAAVGSLEAGGDAYLVKGTDLAVIEATLRAVLRRSAMTSAPGGMADWEAPAAAPPRAWRLRFNEWQLTAPDGTSLALTHKERIFLSVLAEAPGTTYSRSDINRAMGRPDTLENERNLDTLIRRLRRKAEKVIPGGLPILTAYGHGYAFGEALRMESDGTSTEA